MRLTGLVYRAHNPRWSFAPTSGDGAAHYGGRFNPVGMPALYTSRHMETAWLEAQQGLPFKAQPLTICAYQVDCADIVDLCDHEKQRALDVSMDQLAGAWEHMASRGIEPPSWRLTKRLVAEKCAGIVVPSFAPGAAPEGRNIVFWKWSSELPHKLTVIDEEARLPRNTRSWEL